VLGGSSAGLAFVSGMKTAEKACWKCLYLNRVSVGRFLYYYTYSPETVYAFGFAADTFEASLLINNQLLGGNLFFGRSQKEACDYMRNFDVNLLDSQQKPMVLNNLKELLLALLYSIYSIYQTLKSRDDSDLSALMGLGESLQYHCQVFYIKAGKYGKTFRPSNSGIYNDLDFLFRLFDRMEQEKVQMQSLYWQLLNYSVLESTRPPRFDLASLERDDFADKVLSQKSVLPIVTRLVFLNSGRRMDHLIRFVQLYESFIKYGGNTNMTDEIKELAIKLGSQIGTVTAADDNPKAGKGKILQLRKCLTLLDFLNVINSLQVRYNLIVNHDILKVINEDNFEYIKQFSVIQALNVYNFKLSKKQNDGEKNE